MSLSSGVSIKTLNLCRVSVSVCFTAGPWRLITPLEEFILCWWRIVWVSVQTREASFTRTWVSHFSPAAVTRSAGKRALQLPWCVPIILCAALVQTDLWRRRTEWQKYVKVRMSFESDAWKHFGCQEMRKEERWGTDADTPPPRTKLDAHVVTWNWIVVS